MKNILFKSLALAVLGGSVPATAVAAYNTNHHNLSVIKKPNPVGFSNNNPVWNRNQQDSFGSDTATLVSANYQGFTIDYQISASTLAYFYPSIGQFVNPGVALYNLLTQGKAWSPTTHYWRPLKKVNNFNTIIGSEIYHDYYLFWFYKDLRADFTWDANLYPSHDMAELTNAVQTGSAFELKFNVIMNQGSVTGAGLNTSVIKNNYPPTAKTNGADAVQGNLFEPDNVLKIMFSAKSCQYIYTHYRYDIHGFLLWINNWYPAASDLAEYVSTINSTKGYKYDFVHQKIDYYWTTSNYALFTANILAQYGTIMQEAGNPANTHGITLLLRRDAPGNLHMLVNPQLQAFRPVYYNVRKILSGSDFSTYAFLTVQDMMALRSASFRYLAPDAGYTTKARDYAIDWLFNTHNPQWADADVVHSWVLGSQLTNPDAWTHAITNWNWKDVDQFMAEAIIQNRGVVLDLHNWYQPTLSTVSYYEQNAVPQKA